MNPSPRPRFSDRNKLLHRFYEPLVLLHVLDNIQGDHIARAGSENPSLDGIPQNELRRRFLDSLSYICDSEKGGDTITAIAAAMPPLTYYVACNKTPKANVISFLRSTLKQLGSVYGPDGRLCLEVENKVLEDCVTFSQKRIKTYWKFLKCSLKKCRDSSQGSAMLSRECIISYITPDHDEI